MNNIVLLSSLAVLEVVVVGMPVFMLRKLERDKEFQGRLSSVLVNVRPPEEERVRRAPGSYVRRMVGGLGGVLLKTGIISPATLVKLENTVNSAGFRGDVGLQVFVGSKILMLVLFPVLAWLAIGGLDLPFAVRGLMIFAGALLGLLLPDYVVGRLHARNARALERGLPDALDLMVICAEAGMGLEHTLSRVAEEMRNVQPKVSQELEMVCSEIRVLSDRRAALKNLGDRAGLESFKRLGATLLQALQYGSPLAGSLRNLAVDLRDEALTRFEGRAARLPVLLTLPMIVLILPCLFLIVGGPAGIQIARVLSH